MDARFIPYDPRSSRALLFAAAVVLVALCAWALVQARLPEAGREPWVRAGLCGAMVVLAAWLLWRLRPRPGFGVTFSARGPDVVRPLSGARVELHWGEVVSVRRMGKKGHVLGLFLHERKPLLLARRFFGSDADYARMCQAFEARVPAPTYDA